MKVQSKIKAITESRSQQELAADSVRVIAWELTRRCTLACRHCRAGAHDQVYQNELTLQEIIRILDSITPPMSPLLIWTGGEPMCRVDLLDIVQAASARGLRSVMAPCGALVTAATMQALKHAGVAACSFSLDGATAATHDAFRGSAGAFDMVIRAMKIAADLKMPFQVNATVCRLNLQELPRIHELALQLGANALDLFFLVPAGRGAALQHLALLPAEMEQVLRWAVEKGRQGPLRVRTTCAPQAVRVWHDLGQPGPQPSGCMAGRGFLFISHLGILQPCGFLPVASGDLRAYDFDLKQTIAHSRVLNELHQPAHYGGACGQCGWRESCGGCRARAYAASGDYLAAEPGCAYSISSPQQD